MRREGTLGRMNGAGDVLERENMAMFFFVCIDLGGWKTSLYHIKRRKEGRDEEIPKRHTDIPISRTSSQSRGTYRLALEA